MLAAVAEVAEVEGTPRAAEVAAVVVATVWAEVLEATVWAAEALLARLGTICKYSSARNSVYDWDEGKPESDVFCLWFHR